MSILAAILLLAPGTIAQSQTVPEIAPAVARLAKTYDKGPDGIELFDVRHLAVDPASGALWIQYGKGTDLPVRIDRKTGTSKVIGREGSGPNEYRRITAITPGVNGEMGIWDNALYRWSWVDAEGVHVRTWPVRTTSLMMGKVFTDVRGRVYLGQLVPPVPGKAAFTTVIVRVDSAAGLRDSAAPPLHDPQKGSWVLRVETPTSKGSSTYQVMFAPSVDWAIDRRGRVFAVWTDSNYVLIRDGSTDRRLRLPDWPDPVTAADRKRASESLDNIEAQAKARGGVFDGPRPAIPNRKPQIAGLLPELNGGIAVRRERACGKLPAWRAPISGARAAADTASCTIVERFDDAGRRLTPFTLSPGDHLMAIRADTAWITRSNADGLMQILELVIPRR